MSDFAQFIQSGGSEVMGLINQSAGAGGFTIVLTVINIMFPVLFFIISKIVHDNLDDSRAEVNDTEAGKDRDYVIWGLYSIKSNLFMILLCLGIAWGFGVAWFAATGGSNIWPYWWKGAFILLAATHLWTVVAGGLKSTAYQYFVDELYDDSDKMKDICVEFGCGHALHGSQEVVRGIDYKS
jgi:hypothetical protein|tara:strand:- start:1602 stop:2147 length:546 start_codon:yes stop_codon:yes gene_type:complete